MNKQSGTNDSFHSFPVHNFLGDGQKLGFHISSSTFESCLDRGSTTPHRHPFYEILLIKSFAGKHIIDFDEYTNVKNTPFLIDIGQTHYWENVTDVEGILIYFTEDFLFEATSSVNSIWEADIFKDVAHKLAVELDEGIFEQILALANIILLEYNDKKIDYTSVIRACLNIMLIKIYRAYQSGDKESRITPASSLVLEFNNLVCKHNTENHPVSFFAKKLGVSVSYLNSMIKHQSGQTPGKIINQSIVTEAKRLLVNTNLTVAEIADCMNFQDVSYFSRLFKKLSGFTPSQYRQDCKEKHGFHAMGV
ncbi:helix-turn-helix transcriptional regulator [Bacillota bacterium]